MRVTGLAAVVAVVASVGVPTLALGDQCHFTGWWRGWCDPNWWTPHAPGSGDMAYVGSDAGLDTAYAFVSGDCSAVCEWLDVGYNPNCVGVVEVSGPNASLDVSRNAYVGASGVGYMVQTGGNVSIGDVLILGDYEGASGTYDLQGGQLSADIVEVGREGRGEFLQSGGTNTCSLQIVPWAGSPGGTYGLSGGTLQIGSRLDVGGIGGGQATLALSGGRIVQEPGAPGDAFMYVTENNGEVRGWAEQVDLPGFLDNSGRVIADGGDLDLSGFAEVRNFVSNPADQGNGWYAENQGRLTLPPVYMDPNDIPDDGNYPTPCNWGERADDGDIDLVNSFRAEFYGLEALTPNDIGFTCTLLDPCAIDVPNAPGLPGSWGTLVGVWDFEEIGDWDYDHVDMIFRYDSLRVEELVAEGLNIDELALYYWDPNGPDPNWVLADNQSYDGTHFRATYTHQSSVFSRMWAIYIPEPATLGLLGLGGLAFLRRRR